MKKTTIFCPYCEKEAKLVCGKILYPHRPDLYHKFFWDCRQCDAYVGCHENSADHKPYGIMANPPLREAKQNAHATFDPVWKNGKMKRKDAYKWLSKKLEIDYENCHIGMFNIEMCNKVISVCRQQGDIK